MRVRGVAAEILRTARKKAGLTQAELAERFGCQQQTISAYERGRKEPTLATLLAMLEAAGFEPRFQLVPLGSESDAEPEQFREAVRELPDQSFEFVNEKGEVVATLTKAELSNAAIEGDEQFREAAIRAHLDRRGR